MLAASLVGHRRVRPHTGRHVASGGVSLGAHARSRVGGTVPSGVPAALPAGATHTPQALQSSGAPCQA
eukprot:1151103-Alexandrium_andersonii.AAC.1